MLERSVVTVVTCKPIVTECHTGEIHPRLRGEDDAGQSGKCQVTAQNAVRAAALQRIE